MLARPAGDDIEDRVEATALALRAAGHRGGNGYQRATIGIGEACAAQLLSLGPGDLGTEANRSEGPAGPQAPGRWGEDQL